jgi:hypothetical protein
VEIFSLGESKVLDESELLSGLFCFNQIIQFDHEVLECDNQVVRVELEREASCESVNVVHLNELFCFGIELGV